jgi:hypothetical protein
MPSVVPSPFANRGFREYGAQHGTAHGPFCVHDALAFFMPQRGPRLYVWIWIPDTKLRTFPFRRPNNGLDRMAHNLSLGIGLFRFHSFSPFSFAIRSAFGLGVSISVICAVSRFMRCNAAS